MKIYLTTDDDGTYFLNSRALDRPYNRPDQRQLRFVYLIQKLSNRFFGASIYVEPSFFAYP